MVHQIKLHLCVCTLHCHHSASAVLSDINLWLKAAFQKSTADICPWQRSLLRGNTFSFWFMASQWELRQKLCYLGVKKHWFRSPVESGTVQNHQECQNILNIESLQLVIVYVFVTILCPNPIFYLSDWKIRHISSCSFFSSFYSVHESSFTTESYVGRLLLRDGERMFAILEILLQILTILNFRDLCPWSRYDK
jgi:hypothetical protein